MTEAEQIVELRKALETLVKLHKDWDKGTAYVPVQFMHDNNAAIAAARDILSKTVPAAPAAATTVGAAPAGQESAPAPTNVFRTRSGTRVDIDGLAMRSDAIYSYRDQEWLFGNSELSTFAGRVAELAASAIGIRAAQPVVVLEVVGNGAVDARVTDHGRAVLPKGIHEFPAHLAQTSRDERDAWRDVLAERVRQITHESRTPEHDDGHGNGELARAAGSYAIAAAIAAYHGTASFHGGPPTWWPWAATSWKPGDPRRMLVKAGALILAEIERRDRAAVHERHDPEIAGAAQHAQPEVERG